MDISNANLESGNTFHLFHEELNRVIKINVIALTLLRQQLASGLSEQEVKEKVYETGELWGGMPSWTNPNQLLDGARRDLGNNGILRVFSAFDVFMDTLEGELGSWYHFTHKTAKNDLQKDIKKAIKAEEEGDSDKLFKLMARRGWNLSNEKHIKSIYTYYRLSRNCIAHRNSIVSTALSECSHSQDLKDALDNWKNFTSDKTVPPIEPLHYGDPIRFTHRDALMASSITRLIAMNINQLVIKEIGIDGIIYLAANRLFFHDILPEGLVLCQNVGKTIYQILHSGRKVKDGDSHEVKKILIDLGIFDECKKKFRRMKERNKQDQQ